MVQRLISYPASLNKCRKLTDSRSVRPRPNRQGGLRKGEQRTRLKVAPQYFGTPEGEEIH